MHDPRRSVASTIGLLMLAVCTAWLVIENTILALAMVWREPGVFGRIALTVLKAAALLTARFWMSPATVALAAAALLILVARTRPAATSRAEIRHG